MSHACFSCNTEIPAVQFGRRDSCDKCGKDTRVCKNCKHYDRSRNNECKEEQASRVVEKEKSNFCEWFQPGGAGATTGPAKDLKSAAEALFKKK